MIGTPVTYLERGMGAGKLPTILDSKSMEERERKWREEKEGRRRGVPAEGG